MTKGGVTTNALDTEPLPPISPPPHSDSRTNNGNRNHSIVNGQDMGDMTKVADPSQDDDDDAKSTSSEQDNERVREKLKKTSIANVRSDSGEHGAKLDTPRSTSVSEADQDMSDGKEDETRRRRKRSFDETDGDGDGEGGGSKDQHSRHRVHERKRSREISEDDMARAAKALNRVKTPPTHPEEDEVMSQGEEASSTMASPRKLERKRGRGRLDEDEKDKEVDPKKKISRKEEEWQRAIERSVPSASRSVSVSAHRLVNEKDAITVESGSVKPAEGEQLPMSSGFANTSVKSPFATAGAGIKPLFGPGTGTSDLFKNSKFGSLSSSSSSPFASTSPFGTLSQSSSLSPFGIGGLSGGSKTKPSGFGGGFGTYGSGFGALASKVDVISSAPKLYKPVGGIMAKPFGAPDEEEKNSDDEDDEGSDGDTEDNKREEATVEEKKDVFTEQEIVTGEENETTIFKCPGKIFFFDKDQKQWKERGRGTLKLNRTIPFAVTESEDEEDLGAERPKLKDTARLIMRTEGTYLVVLNVPIYKGMKLGGDINGGVPTTNQLQFMTLENGKPIQMIIKVWYFPIHMLLVLLVGDRWLTFGGVFPFLHEKCKSVVIAKELHNHVGGLQQELFT